MKSRRIGFTVVEMLVVIAIIGVLAALLLPAIQAAREQARQIQCVSQMSQLAKAVATYTTTKQELPPLRKQSSNGTNQVYLGWPAILLGDLGENGLATQLDQNIRGGTPTPTSVFASLKVLICPSDISPSSDDKLKLSYAANSGCPNNYGNAALDYLGNGVFHDAITSIGSTNYRRQRFLLSDFADGASNTILFSENADVDIWPTLSAVDMDTSAATATELAGSIVWYPGTDSSSNSDPNTPPVINVSGVRSPLIGNPDAGRSVVNFTVADAWQYASPSSRHPSVIIMAFGDGSARRIGKSLDYGVYCLLMSSNGQKSFDPADGTPPPTQIPWQATRRLPDYD